MTKQPAASGPLAGVRVVEFDAIGPLPLAGMILADMGADVVRITRPVDSELVQMEDGGSVLYRGRTSIELDLKHRNDIALDIVSRADIAMEGLRPGVMERLGLGPDACLARNPKLVYGRMTGWGQTGPRAPRAGHDINYISLTGALHAMGAPGEPPPLPLNLIGDYGGGTMFLITGILAALLSARMTGQGQVIDAAMVDGVATLTALFRAYRANGAWSDARQANLLDGGTPFYRCYTCADGGFVAVGSLEPKFFAMLLMGLGLTADAFVQQDKAGWPKMERRFAEIFASQPRDHWMRIFDGTDACVTPVLSWAESEADPHLVGRGIFTPGDPLGQPAPAPRFSATPAAIRERTETSAEALFARWPL